LFDAAPVNDGSVAGCGDDMSAVATPIYQTCRYGRWMNAIGNSFASSLSSHTGSGMSAATCTLYASFVNGECPTGFTPSGAICIRAQ
jgi:hypothetical protein